MVPLQAEPLYLARKSGSIFKFPVRGLGLITDPFENTEVSVRASTQCG